MDSKLVTKAGFPNYKAGVSTNTFTADQPYFIVASKPAAGNNSAVISINGATVINLQGTSQGYNQITGCCYCDKGDSVSISLNNASCVRYPLK